MFFLNYKRYNFDPVLIFMLACLSIFETAYAQQSVLNFSHLDVNNGLSSGTVNCIYKDTRGFVWISTYDGLNQFDGINTKVYREDSSIKSSISGTLFLNILEDKIGNLWVGSNKGLNYFNRRDNKFINFKIPNRENDQQFVSPFYIDIENNIWLRSGYDIIVFNTIKKSFLTIRKFFNSKSLSISTFPQQQYQRLEAIYVVSSKNTDILKATLYKDSISWAAMNLPKGSGFQRINCVYPLKDKIWLGTDKGLALLAGKTIASYDQFENKNIKEVEKISFDKNGIMVLGTSYEGLYFFDSVKKVFLSNYFNTVNNKYSISGNEVNYLHIDNENSLWLSIWGKGISYVNLDRFSFSHYLNNRDAETVGINNFIKSIIEVNENELWCGTHKDGIIILDKEKRFIRKINSGIDPSIEHLLLDSKGIVWVATLSGLFTINSSSKIVRRVVLPSSIANTRTNQFNFVFELRNGSIIASTNSGLLLIKGSEKSYTVFPIKGVSDRDVFLTNYEDSDGSVYLSRAFKGFVQGAISEDSFIVHKEYPMLATIKSYLELGNDLWVGSTIGLLKVDKNAKKIEKIFTSKDGLSNQYIYGVLPDNGSLWISTNMGINRMSLTDYKVKSYTVEDGLQNNEFNTYSFFKVTTGELIFGGVNGISAFFPNQMNTTSHPPMLQLDKVQVNDVAFKYQIDTDAENLLKLKYDQNTISFQFKVLDYINPSANYIQYKLENFDANWIFADNNSKIRFANLPYGDYVLLVKGFNSDNIETETIFKLNISIATPWWRSWLFYFLIVLVSSAIVLATIAYRIKSLKKNYEVRLKISQDLHDEVGATLSGIAMYSHLAKNQIQTLDLESVNNSLNVINESSNDIVSKLNDIVWLINPEKDTLKQLISRLEDYAIKMAATKEMQVLISLPDKILERTLQADTKRNIFLFCKEAINNVIKHSGATVFNFTVVQEKGILSFILADNGVGFDIDNTKNGNGMENMRTRARQMNATLQVNSTIGKGTTLNLILKSPNRG